MSIEHAFNGKQNLSWKFNEGGVTPINLLSISSFENNNNDNLQFSRISRSFSPLIGISTTFNNGISTNVRSNITHTLDEVANGLTYISDNSILATITYNFSKGIRFSLTFSERNIYLRNNIKSWEILALLLLPSFILYSSVSLREVLIIFFTVISLISLIEKKYLVSLLCIFLIFMISILIIFSVSLMDIFSFDIPRFVKNYLFKIMILNKRNSAF